MKTQKGTRPITAILICALLSLSGIRAYAGQWIRMNQLGYLPTSSKVAVLLSNEEISVEEFRIVDVFSGETVFSGSSSDIKETGKLQNMESTFRLNFSSLEKEGTYRMEVLFKGGSVSSDIFPISSHAYDGTADFVLNYMRQQRCGWNPFLKDSCHTKDAIIVYHPTKSGQHLDVKGGWHDASDCLQYTTTTANAIYQNIEYMESYNPEYVLILSGDHIYKMDYEVMLDFHKSRNAEVTIAVMPVPMEEASRFGIVIADEDRKIRDFEEKPEKPRSNLASMGIYIFSWQTLKEALCELKDQSALDFGKHVIPYCHSLKKPLYAYEFNGYWKDVGTLSSYWEANMELIDIVPEFNLYEEYWKIYTQAVSIPPQYFGSETAVERCIIGEGSEIYGEVYNSVLGCDVVVGKGSIVRDSIIMNGVVIGENCDITKGIVAEEVSIGDRVCIGEGDDTENETAPHIYNHGLVTVGEKSVIPSDVVIGRNVCIAGETDISDYPDGKLPSGRTLIKAGETA